MRVEYMFLGTSSVPPPLNLLHLIFLLISNIRSGKFNFNFPVRLHILILLVTGDLSRLLRTRKIIFCLFQNFMQRKDVAEPDMLLVDVEREVYEVILLL